VVIAGTFGLTYLFSAILLRVPEARALLGRMHS
jgi:hypothetical protein